jgi:hypothetical protein
MNVFVALKTCLCQYPLEAYGIDNSTLFLVVISLVIPIQSKDG